jgi:lipopolysaccharide export system permease protein
MVTSAERRLYPPLIARHLQGAFLRLFGLALVVFILIYLLADFFDRFDTVLRHDPPLWAVIETFLLKLPVVVTQVAPVAVLAASLLGLGLLARHREIVALKACGVSRWQLIAPLLLAGAVVTIASIAWNELVVPTAAQRWHTVWNREIKGKKSSSVFAGREVWYRGVAGLYNFQRVRIGRRTLLGVTIYQLDDNFTPNRIIVAKRALWTGDRWTLEGAETITVDDAGPRVTTGAPEDFTIPEALDDFRVADVEPEALSFRMLREQIRVLRAKGIDTSESWVDLYLKLALPLGTIVMILIGVPLATQGSGRGTLGTAIGMALAIGFAYFMVVAFARALGQNGALPPLVAAWVSNVLFALVGLYLILGSD